MFNRVAGGNYTKAADISSDILAKLRHDMPEDDSRVPNVIADFIGDNVNDIAGNCSDLLESFVATMAAALMIAVTIYKSALSGGTEAVTEATFTATTVFPIVLAGCGLFGCLLGLGYATIKKMGDNPSHELNLSELPLRLAVAVDLERARHRQRRRHRLHHRILHLHRL